jgi:viroplasmin and RNaseH domain-containing protein
MRIRTLLAVALLPLGLMGCASSIEQIGPNKYRMQLAPQTDEAAAEAAEYAAEQDAEAFCQGQNKSVSSSTTDTTSISTDSGTSIRTTFTFKCK